MISSCWFSFALVRSCSLYCFQEVIPCLNEHMEDTCTSDLLGYIRSLVLSRIQVNEDQVRSSYMYSLLNSRRRQQQKQLSHINMNNSNKRKISTNNNSNNFLPSPAKPTTTRSCFKQKQCVVSGIISMGCFGMFRNVRCSLFLVLLNEPFLLFCQKRETFAVYP